MASDILDKYSDVQPEEFKSQADVLEKYNFLDAKSQLDSNKQVGRQAAKEVYQAASDANARLNLEGKSGWDKVGSAVSRYIIQPVARVPKTVEENVINSLVQFGVGAGVLDDKWMSQVQSNIDRSRAKDLDAPGARTLNSLGASVAEFEGARKLVAGTAAKVIPGADKVLASPYAAGRAARGAVGYIAGLTQGSIDDPSTAGAAGVTGALGEILFSRLPAGPVASTASKLGVNRTLGQTLESKTLQNLEEIGAASKAQFERENQDMINVFKKLEDSATPQAVRDETGRLNAAGVSIDSATKRLKTGEILVDDVKKTLPVFRAEVSALYEPALETAVSKLGKKEAVNTKTYANKILESVTNPETNIAYSDEFKNIATLLADDGFYNARQLQFQKEELDKFIAKGRNNPDKKVEVGEAMRLRSAVSDDYLAQMDEAGVGKEARAADAKYMELVKPTQDLAYGNFADADKTSSIVATMMNPGKRKNALKLVNALSPEGKKAFEYSMLEHIAEKSTKDGILNVRKAMEEFSNMSSLYGATASKEHIEILEGLQKLQNAMSPAQVALATGAKSDTNIERLAATAITGSGLAGLGGKAGAAVGSTVAGPIGAYIGGAAGAVGLPSAAAGMRWLIQSPVGRNLLTKLSQEDMKNPKVQEFIGRFLTSTAHRFLNEAVLEHDK